MAVDMRSFTAAPPLRTAATAADTRKRVSFSAALAAEAGRVDDTYFDSYSYFDIHREMLGDKARALPLPSQASPACSSCISVCMPKADSAVLH